MDGNHYRNDGNAEEGGGAAGRRSWMRLGKHPHAVVRAQHTAWFLPPSNIALDVSVSSKKRLLEQIGLVFENNQGIARRLVFDSLFARERLGSTAIGQGVALPHGRIKGLAAAVGAFLRLQTGVAFDAPDGRPVHLVFALLVPELATEHHLEMMRRLAHMCAARELRERLATTADPSAVHRHIVASYAAPL